MLWRWSLVWKGITIFHQPPYWVASALCRGKTSPSQFLTLEELEKNGLETQTFRDNRTHLLIWNMIPILLLRVLEYQVDTYPLSWYLLKSLCSALVRYIYCSVIVLFSPNLFNILSIIKQKYKCTVTVFPPIRPAGIIYLIVIYSKATVHRTKGHSTYMCGYY